MIGNPVSRRERCLEIADEPDGLLFADGYDSAILGIANIEGVDVVAYDSAKVISILRRRDGMTRDEAEEFFDYNIGGGHFGERTPIFTRPVR